MSLIRAPRFASTLTAIALAAAAWYQLRTGVDAAPAPMRELVSYLTGHAPDVAARLIVAAEIATAAALLVAGTRLLAVVASGACAFVSLASVSRAFDDGGLLLPASSLAVSLGLLALAARSVPSAPRDGRRGLSPAWSALFAIAAATVAAQWTASASFRDPSAAASDAQAADRSRAPAPQSTVPSIDLDMRAFLEKPLSESTLAKYLPEIVELCGDRDTYIVVYNPSCESCHTLFAETFTVPRRELVVAVAVPLGDGAVSAASEPPRPIECLDCEERTLPQGPNWIVAPPLVIKVERGKIVCVADRFGGDCLPK